jgi:hypothetical protein
MANKHPSSKEPFHLKTYKISTEALSKSPGIKSSFPQKKEKKHSHVPLICSAVVLLGVLGFFYYRFQKIKVSCNNLCDLLREDAVSNETFSLHNKNIDNLLQCQNWLGDKICE